MYLFPLDGPSGCCAPTVSLAQSLGGEHACPECGEVYRGRDVTAVHAVARASTAPDLATVLHELALARRWQRDHSGGGLGFADRSPLARLQGEADGADRDASARQVSALWSLASSDDRAGAYARDSFVGALEKYCARGGGAVDALDDLEWAAARRYAEQLDALAQRGDPASLVLGTLGARCTERTSEEEAARIVADAHAPPALRAAWDLTAEPTGERGRPRRDPSRPPPDTERLAYGRELLTHARTAWGRAARR